MWLLGLSLKIINKKVIKIDFEPNIACIWIFFVKMVSVLDIMLSIKRCFALNLSSVWFRRFKTYFFEKFEILKTQ